jgi:hypothetical protein
LWSRATQALNTQASTGLRQQALTPLNTALAHRKGVSLMRISIAGFIALASGGFSVEAGGIAGIIEALKFSTSEGLPDVLQVALAYVLVMTFLSLGLVIDSYARERREALSGHAPVRNFLRRLPACGIERRPRGSACPGTD